MKTLMVAVAVAAALGAGITSCGQGPLEPDAATRGIQGEVSASASASGSAVIHSVTGNGHFLGEPRDRSTTFQIFEFADGTVMGWAHTQARGVGGVRARIRIDCLHVVGNQAWASGIVVAAINPDNIGRPYAYRFIDNGEGENAAPDEIATFRFQDYDCMTEPDLNTRPLAIGNIRIR